MNTDDLIRRLAADPRPARPLAQGLAARVLPALLGALALLVLGWGLRADLAGSLADPVTAMKPLLPGVAAILAMMGALHLAHPGGQARAMTRSLILLGMAALGLVALDLAPTPAGDWATALRGRTLVACLLSIPALAVLPTVALLLALRRGASLTPARSGALAGLAGGAAAAALYALHCDEDAPLFFVTWYGTAILATSLVGAALGRRWLRW
jgi:hypothetical protein